MQTNTHSLINKCEVNSIFSFDTALLKQLLKLPNTDKCNCPISRIDAGMNGRHWPTKRWVKRNGLFAIPLEYRVNAKNVNQKNRNCVHLTRPQFMFETVGRLSKLNRRESEETTHFTGFCLTFCYRRWIQTVQCVEHIVYFQFIIFSYFFFFTFCLL